MGWFGKKKDWNVIAVLFESKGQYSVNGNRAKAAEAVAARDGVRRHKRAVFWAVFDQQRSFLEGEPGPGAHLVPREVLTKLMRELPTIRTVQEVLSVLESGQQSKVAKILPWNSAAGAGQS